MKQQIIMFKGELATKVFLEVNAELSDDARVNLNS